MSAFLKLGELDRRLSRKCFEDNNVSVINPDLPELKTIILNRENGINTRNFTGNVNVPAAVHYQSILTLFYLCDNDRVLYPNRVVKYRNHFCLYTGLDGTVLIVRSETTLKFQNQDAVVYYNVLRLTDRALSTCCAGRWVISFDKCEHSTECPESFLPYTLCCYGEWWYYERGVILNGIHGVRSCLVYYELHPKQSDRSVTYRDNNNMTVEKPSSTKSNIQDALSTGPLESPLNTLNTYVSNDYPNRTPIVANNLNINPPLTYPSHSDNVGGIPTPENGGITSTVTNKFQQLPKLATLLTTEANDRLITSTIRESPAQTVVTPSILRHPTIPKYEQRQVVQSNSIHFRERKTETLIPSAFWFKARDEELKCGDIKYFFPT